MTERERWIVYPLLFLALGAALRDKLIDRTITKSIVCEELTATRRIVCPDLTVVDEESANDRQSSRILARIGRTETKGAAAPSVLGELLVNGVINANGLINANRYACQGIPLMPGILIPRSSGGQNPQPTRSQNPNTPNATRQENKKQSQQPNADEQPAPPADDDPDSAK
jgi:hypothetical protein